jgi:hypothetical protein
MSKLHVLIVFATDKLIYFSLLVPHRNILSGILAYLRLSTTKSYH